MQDAIDRLSDSIDSHGFYSPSVQELADPFGVKLQFSWHQANTSDPKGLSLDNGQDGAEGIAGYAIPVQICNALNVPYKPKLGRGFQFRTCIEALREHFKGRAE